MKNKTKAELIEELEDLYSKFLGYKTLKVSRNRTKDQYSREIFALRKAVAWKRYADKIRQQILNQYGESYWMVEIDPMLQYKLETAHKKANEYWLSNGD